ncbi:cysteine hydrolase family protein [Balneatrix alpica]|uniref:Cysteine hydrolase family protein n=1 Tax=Balneatrix alpica TaxID=75684 RepID=A0ABV5ZFJ2_9GAMM|nr:cysteine hydrolase family protein [Balneatrix alpica]
MAAVLVLIDMQQGMRWPSLPARNNPHAEQRLAALLQHWRQQRWPLLHVRHLSTSPESPFWPEQSGVEFQEAFRPRDGETVWDKKVPDAFTHSGLEEWLRGHGWQHLVIAGVSTHNSVEATVRSAANRGFQVRVVADACFTFGKHDLSGRWWPAEEIHALSLANMQEDYADVVHSSDWLDCSLLEA